MSAVTCKCRMVSARKLRSVVSVRVLHSFERYACSKHQGHGHQMFVNPEYAGQTSPVPSVAPICMVSDPCGIQWTTTCSQLSHLKLLLCSLLAEVWQREPALPYVCGRAPQQALTVGGEEGGQPFIGAHFRRRYQVQLQHRRLYCSK